MSHWLAVFANRLFPSNSSGAQGGSKTAVGEGGLSDPNILSRNQLVIIAMSSFKSPLNLGLQLKNRKSSGQIFVNALR